MSDAAFDSRFGFKDRQAPRAEAITLPRPVPYAAPVLIGDCATPLAGETVLSLLWKRLERDQE